MKAGLPADRGGRGLGLWRLPPYFGLLLLAVGIVRHGLGGPVDPDGARTAFFALFLAGFIAVYGRPALFGAGATAPRPARERTSRFAAMLVGALALAGAAAFSQAGWLGLWTPRTRTDWQMVALDLASVWLYALHFHAAWSERREARLD
jgi:hypothetical protein